MARRTASIFENDIYAKHPKQNYATNKIKVYNIDDTWSLDLSDLNNYGPKNNIGYRDILVAIDIFLIFGWTVRSVEK